MRWPDLYQRKGSPIRLALRVLTYFVQRDRCQVGTGALGRVPWGPALGPRIVWYCFARFFAGLCFAGLVPWGAALGPRFISYCFVYFDLL